MQYILQRLNLTLRAVHLKGITILKIKTWTAKVNYLAPQQLKLVIKQGSYYVREPLLYVLCKIVINLIVSLLLRHLYIGNSNLK